MIKNKGGLILHFNGCFYRKFFGHHFHPVGYIFLSGRFFIGITDAKTFSCDQQAYLSSINQCEVLLLQHHPKLPSQ